MTPAQVAANAAALRNLAARLERLGYTGDSHTEAEHIAVNLLADGYREIPRPEPIPEPGSSTAEARRAALEAAATAVRDAREKRKTTHSTQEER